MADERPVYREDLRDIEAQIKQVSAQVAALDKAFNEHRVEILKTQLADVQRISRESNVTATEQGDVKFRVNIIWAAVAALAAAALGGLVAVIVQHWK